MNRIAQLRKEKHLNQVGLSMKLNISQCMISSYETGRYQIPTDMLIKLADFFNVSVDYLIGKSDIRYPADSFSQSNLTEQEIELLNLFRTLPKDRQVQAMGVLFALQNI